MASIDRPAAPEPQAPRRRRTKGPEQAVCQGRSPCRVKSTTEAGSDSSGNHLLVVEASLSPDPAEAQAEPGPPDAPSPCETIEHWLVASRESEEHGAEARLLLVSCNDGYGAAGVGEDGIEVRHGLFRHTRSGGSSWRWSQTTELSLAPLAITAAEMTGAWTLGPNAETSRWSSATFSGETRWFSPPCGPNGEPDWAGDRAPEMRAFVALPLVDLDQAFALDGWRSASLGACSARLDASGEGGFVVRGQPGAAGDARLRVVASTGQQLFVEIEDDTWVTGRGPVERQDHLELWSSPHASGYGDPCLERGGGKPLVAMIRLSDGKVFPGGSTPGPSADIAAPPSPGQPMRLRLDLPPGLEALTVVYADADRPGLAERAIATSDLRPRESASLGRLRRVPEREASCGLEGGRLEPRRKAPPEGEAVIGGL